MPDKILKCVECGADWVWTAGEQDFFREKGFTEPKRCPTCRKKKREKFTDRQTRGYNK